MRGPGFRYDNDVRRVWECPVCGQRIRMPGNRTTQRCPCKEGGILMRIVDEGVRRVFPPREKIVIPDDTAVPVEIAVEAPDVPLESLADAADSHFAENDSLAPAPGAGVEPADESAPAADNRAEESDGGGEVHIEGLSVDESTTGRRRREKNRRRHKQRREREHSAGSAPASSLESGSPAQAEPETPPPASAPPKPAPQGEPPADEFGANIFDN